MHRIIPTQARQKWQKLIGLPDRRMCEVNLIQRDGPRIASDQAAAAVFGDDGLHHVTPVRIL
jgi:hypothetical protein